MICLLGDKQKTNQLTIIILDLCLFIFLNDNIVNFPSLNSGFLFKQINSWHKAFVHSESFNYMVKDRGGSLLLGNECGSVKAPCDRWQCWLDKTGCWWSGQLCLTVACCFSAFSFASSSCFCKAAWRDFISSLSSEREVRNTLLALPPYIFRGLDCSTTEWPS